jgi:SEC-C motif domain protein
MVRGKISASSDCLCRLREAAPLSYGQCCQLWHLGLREGKHAPSAEALMRSRYSAYALATHNDSFGHSMLQYLLDTWHLGTSPGDIELGPTQWTGLEVLHCQDGGDAAVVEFIAHFKVNGKADKLHELSRFVRLHGVWKYIDGDILNL